MSALPETYTESESRKWYDSLKLEAKMDVDMKIEMIMSDGETSEAAAIALAYRDQHEKN